VETIAVYWEPKIKTYGFHEALDLCLLRLEFRSKRLPEWGLGIYELGNRGMSFQLVLLQQRKDLSLRLYLLFEPKWKEELTNQILQGIHQHAGEIFQIVSPVELIYFFGPHFGDRYGIADSALKALEHNNVTALVTGCSGSAIYIVLPQGMAGQAKVLLAEMFDVPS
jgi:hypothetical protein